MIYSTRSSRLYSSLFTCFYFTIPTKSKESFQRIIASTNYTQTNKPCHNKKITTDSQKSLLTLHTNDIKLIVLLKPLTLLSRPPSSSSSSTSRLSTNQSTSCTRDKNMRPTSMRNCQRRVVSGYDSMKIPMAQTLIVIWSLRWICVSIARIS